MKCLLTSVIGGYGWKRRWHGCSNGTPGNSATRPVAFGNDKACFKCLDMKKVSLFNGKMEFNTLLEYCVGANVSNFFYLNSHYYQNS